MDKPQSTISAAVSTGGPFAAPVQFRRDEDFFSLYANNVLVESNAFDLKLILGMTDLRDPSKPAVDQIASVSLSWPQVKLLIFWMQMHLAGYERENGRVNIPTNAVPPPFPENPPPPFDNPQGRDIFGLMRKLRDEFAASLKT